MKLQEMPRFGVVGSNFITDKMMAALSALEAPVVSIFSRTEERGREYAARFGIPGVYTDYTAFLNSGIDAVYIATPNYIHSEMTDAALRAGVHVLVEKPAAISQREFLASSALARERGLVLMEAMRPLHDPFSEKIKELLPRIGRLRRAVIDFCQYSSRYDSFLQGDIKNAFRPELGNAALMDIGVYCIALSAFFFGQPTSVSSHSVFLHNGMEGEGSAILGYDGFNVDIKYSKIADSCFPSYFQGECGTLSFDHPVSPRVLTLALRNGIREEILLTPPENNMVCELADFCRLVGENPEERTDRYTEYTLTALSVMDKIRAQNGICFS